MNNKISVYFLFFAYTLTAMENEEPLQSRSNSWNINNLSNDPCKLIINYSLSQESQYTQDFIDLLTLMSYQIDVNAPEDKVLYPIIFHNRDKKLKKIYYPWYLINKHFNNICDDLKNERIINIIAKYPRHLNHSLANLFKGVNLNPSEETYRLLHQKIDINPQTSLTIRYRPHDQQDNFKNFLIQIKVEKNNQFYTNNVTRQLNLIPNKYEDMSIIRATTDQNWNLQFWPFSLTRSQSDTYIIMLDPHEENKNYKKHAIWVNFLSECERLRHSTNKEDLELSLLDKKIIETPCTLI